MMSVCTLIMRELNENILSCFYVYCLIDCLRCVRMCLFFRSSAHSFVRTFVCLFTTLFVYRLGGGARAELGGG